MPASGALSAALAPENIRCEGSLSPVPSAYACVGWTEPPRRAEEMLMVLHVSLRRLIPSSCSRRRRIAWSGRTKQQQQSKPEAA